MSQKIAIIGTAPSWRLTPWTDASVECWGLNDGYNLPGFQRADRWYDLHPLDHFFFAPEPPPGQRPVIMAHTVPVGYYVRPAKHLDWLATQPFPVYLHPDHAMQHPASAAWPHARAFPKAAIEAHFGQYFTSSPAWMLAHAILEGATEIHIYGIHLSTESEYIEQRPGFEFLIGCFLGSGKRTMRVVNGVRRYESPQAVLFMPEASPVLASNFQYAFEPSPRRQLEPLKWELHKAQVKLTRTLDALRGVTPWALGARVTEPIPNDPAGQTITRWKSRRALRDDWYYHEALVADCTDALNRMALGVTHG